MSNSSPRFSVEIDGISGSCPSGEKWAEENIARKAIPVLSCEGPCIRGEIARLAANIVSRSEPYARACYAEATLVPHSAMAKWVKQADKIVMIDGCFLRCIGRLMNNLANRDNIVHIDALALHKKYAKVFHMDEVPQAERDATAQLTADKILALLQDGESDAAGSPCGCSA
jgi:uncharacterized metal-binding protein